MSEEKSPEYQARLNANRKVWDEEAETFDNEADHGLKSPVVRHSWKKLLSEVLPQKQDTSVLDIGCGTGSLSVLLAELGYTVTSCDFSPEMIAKARYKAKKAKKQIEFHIMDAAFPTFESAQFDIILCRHLLWALPEQRQVLKRWTKLLKPAGNLVLIEGFWHTGAGLHSEDIVSIMPSTMTNVSVKNLSEESNLWGKSVTDERFLIHACLNE